MARAWYAVLIGKDPYDALNYIQITNLDFCLCGYKLCAIYAASNGDQPARPLSENIKLYISQGLATAQMQPEFPLTAKKYVYLRS